MIQTVAIANVATDGVEYLEDIRAIERKYGLLGVFSFDPAFLDYEQYVSIREEAAFSFALAITAILFVVLIFTASATVTLIIVLSVLLVMLFLLGMLHYWSIDFNQIVLVNLVISTGLAVDYSAHIGHSFIAVECPADDPTLRTNSAKRKFKARTALRQMGTSVFHGGFSTLLAVLVLGFSQSYIFNTFFRLWLGILVFGMVNGFLFVPIMLSICGPAGKTPRNRGSGALGPTKVEMFEKVKGDDSMVVNREGSPLKHLSDGKQRAV